MPRPAASAPWSVHELEQAFVVQDASGQAQANVLTHDEARRIAANIAKLPGLLSPAQSLIGRTILAP